MADGESGPSVSGLLRHLWAMWDQPLASPYRNSSASCLSSAETGDTALAMMMLADAGGPAGGADPTWVRHIHTYQHPNPLPAAAAAPPAGGSFAMGPCGEQQVDQNNSQDRVSQPNAVGGAGAGRHRFARWRWSGVAGRQQGRGLDESGRPYNADVGQELEASVRLLGGEMAVLGDVSAFRTLLENFLILNRGTLSLTDGPAGLLEVQPAYDVESGGTAAAAVAQTAAPIPVSGSSSSSGGNTQSANQIVDVMGTFEEFRRRPRSVLGSSTLRSSSAGPINHLDRATSSLRSIGSREGAPTRRKSRQLPAALSPQWEQNQTEEEDEETAAPRSSQPMVEETCEEEEDEMQGESAPYGLAFMLPPPYQPDGREMEDGEELAADNEADVAEVAVCSSVEEAEVAEGEGAAFEKVSDEVGGEMKVVSEVAQDDMMLAEQCGYEPTEHFEEME
eukprot:gb/GEZN01004525.1/.p1 GENE.gb/GEZN01004525.1/~~gb/GEZN01004525.1/.p1  ORF type:complete len:449 (-),score=96.06 gb/GEZN01004525.1/:211-1557(-)